MRYDTIVVGGGSAGLSAAQALARARRQVLVVDAGQPRNRFAAAVHNVLGHDGKTPAQLLAAGREELARYPTASIFHGEARTAVANSEGFSLTLVDGRVVSARTLVLATGVGDVLPPLEGQDDAGRNQSLAVQLLADHPELAAIYSVGAGNAGICQALRGAGRDQSTVFVGHELTAVSRAELLNGTMDAVINQDAGHEIRSALRVALAQWSQEPVLADQERIRIDIYLKDNLP